MKICTVGHSSLELGDFIAILKDAGVTWVADVRSSPYSGRFRHFNRRHLVEALKRDGIRYLYLGDRLGGKPPHDSGDKWTQGRLSNFIVSRLSSSPAWQEGLRELGDIVVKMDQSGETGCLLCSEANPNDCHRSAVAFDLERRIPGLHAVHLLPKGSPATSVRVQKTLFRVADDESHYH